MALSDFVPGINGHLLPLSEQTVLEVSFVSLAEQYKGALGFWGKIFGTQNDYLIATVHAEDILKTRKTLYSNDGGLCWCLLDPVTPQQASLCRRLAKAGLFIGDPSFEYRLQQRPDGSIVDEDEEEDEEAQSKNTLITVPESVRLAYVVGDIDHHCRLAPRGAFQKDPHGNVVQNPTYVGLSHNDAGKLGSYFHLRPYDIDSEGLLATEHLQKSLHFLEPISSDIPQGIWSLRLEPVSNLVVAANLLYEGFVFYSKPGAPQFGQYYFGDGTKNDDLPFML
eukprot:NODE_3056_length_987_cov_18.988273_g2554_i0.p1 GENE.NODE_3056_length_987_cov_18.988273_g2554_i0~~NODE_3056_length_987_cov_18.988273_g2554_i0.p1  ORF type:complete len:280 (-),score=72.90 NODE_3056_length_987_cov_18.988273_g2554_i0:96-935(-)